MLNFPSNMTALVTGATGYVAGWVVRRLLDDGFTVHAAVRDPSKTEKLEYLDELAEEAPGTIRYFKSDLMEGGSYAEAMQGCSVVFHTASPFVIRVEDPQRDLIDPAQLGTRNVLEQANTTQSVERVVVTSSCAAIYGDNADLKRTKTGKFTEDDWNTSSSVDHQPYSFSKTLAEKEAWKIAEAQDRWDLVTVNPTLVLGPAINPFATSESFALVKQMADGTMKAGVPNYGMGVVDVRDVAEMHMQAAFNPAAKGRYITSGHNSSFHEVAFTLRDHFGDSTPAPWQYEPRQPRPDDVSIEILYCGVCHTDIHFVENDWGMTVYPVVPGHEIIGRVTAVGPEVSGFKVGDMVGAGCLVDSCRECSSCTNGLEQYCVEGPVFTYNGVDRHDGKVTYGGYSERILVSDRFVVHLPEGLDPAAAAPLLCAGITTYSPWRHVGLKPGENVGVVGMGGLGHMGIKFAKAMGANVTLFTRSTSKVEEGKRNGADHVVISSDADQMQQAVGSLKYVLDTVPVEHDLNPYIACLGVDGVYLLVGQLTPLSPPVDAIPLVLGRRSILGSAIGGMPETQQMLDFCAEQGISCDIEMLDIRNIGEAYERMKRGDVRYRFVIDMASLTSA